MLPLQHVNLGGGGGYELITAHAAACLCAHVSGEAFPLLFISLELRWLRVSVTESCVIRAFDEG